MLSHWLLATMVSDENRLLIFLRSLCTCHFWCLLGVSAIFWQFYYNMSWCKSLWLYPLSFVVCWASVTYAAAAKSLQSCPTLCNPIDSSPPGSPVPGILQARTLEWGAFSFSNAWKWKGKVKSLSHVRLFATPWTAAYQAPPSMEFSRQEYFSSPQNWLTIKVSKGWKEKQKTALWGIRALTDTVIKLPSCF